MLDSTTVKSWRLTEAWEDFWFLDGVSCTYPEGSKEDWQALAKAIREQQNFSAKRLSGQWVDLDSVAIYSPRNRTSPEDQVVFSKGSALLLCDQIDREVGKPPQPLVEGQIEIFAMTVEEAREAISKASLEQLLHNFDGSDSNGAKEEPIDLWQLRALASLPVIEAAIKLTQVRFEIRGKSPSETIVPTADYEALKAAVELYLAAANREKGE